MKSFKPYKVSNKETALIQIGIEIATKAHIETDCHRLVPVDTRIIFGQIDRSDYSTETIHQIMAQQGYSPNSWVAKRVWQTTNDNPF